MYLDNSEEATLINIKLTEKGRELLAKGFKDDNVFDITRFSFGDSEVDYTLIEDNDDTDIYDQYITSPSNETSDIVYKIYATGTVPTGEATVSVSMTDVNLTQYQITETPILATTSWPPVSGIYNEEYKWTNLGPLNDYDIEIVTSVDTKNAVIRALDVAGTTTIKVMGMTSGAYSLITITIT